VSVDAGPKDSRLNFQGHSIPFHGHLFREQDGFRFSERDRAVYPAALLNEIEGIVNGVQFSGNIERKRR
jgi:hypothetical protein